VYGNTLTFSPDNTLASGIYILEIEYNNYKSTPKRLCLDKLRMEVLTYFKDKTKRI
jgi:hypothetical protein